MIKLLVILFTLTFYALNDIFKLILPKNDNIRVLGKFFKTVVLYSIDEINIGSHCVISQKSYICTGSHDIKDPAFSLQTEKVVIGNGAWVATDCFVGPGVTIGANAVVGARSTVFTDMPDGQVCWGTPCRPRYARNR